MRTPPLPLSLSLILSTVLLGGCQLTSPPSAAPPAAATGSAQTQPGSSSAADLPAAELRDVLTDLARAHQQKIQLAWWVSTPLRPVSPPFRPFYQDMGKEQKELLEMIRAWAREHRVDLTFHYADDTDGRALKIMEDRQEKLVRNDSQPDFERDMLIQEYSDYEWQVSQLRALLPRIRDPRLKDYATKSLQVHERGSRQILDLLKRFKFAG